MDNIHIDIGEYLRVRSLKNRQVKIHKFDQAAFYRDEERSIGRKIYKMLRSNIESHFFCVMKTDPEISTIIKDYCIELFGVNIDECNENEFLIRINRDKKIDDILD